MTFKVGDKVRYTKEFEGNDTHLGMFGVIGRWENYIGVEGCDEIALVEFADGGHWWIPCSEEYLQKGKVPTWQGSVLKFNFV